MCPVVASAPLWPIRWPTCYPTQARHQLRSLARLRQGWNGSSVIERWRDAGLWGSTRAVLTKHWHRLLVERGCGVFWRYQKLPGHGPGHSNLEMALLELRDWTRWPPELLLWFSPNQQLGTTQALTHFPPIRTRERRIESVKVRNLVGWDESNLTTIILLAIILQQ